MQHEFGVTIATKLELTDICDTVRFNHVCVLDLRRCINNGPFPIEEATLKRLRNFFVAYEQMPTSMYSASPREQNELFRTIGEQAGNVLVLTDHPVQVARFCKDLDIPFRSREVLQVEMNGDEYVPVQLQRRGPAHVQFGSFGA